MVPAGMIKKLHGQAVFADEVLRTVEKELTRYMDTEKLNIFAQPLPATENDPNALDVNNPQEYTFGFEVGLKPEFALPELSAETLPLYKVQVTDEMVNQQIERLQKGYGKKKDPEGDNSDENVEKAELNEDLFKAAYPAKEIKTEEEFRAAVKEDMEKYWDTQARNHLQHEIYHRLLDHTRIEFPENFLKRWLEVGTDKQKTAEEVEKEYPNFVNQLKWTLITDKLATEKNLEVTRDDIKDFAKKQLFGYMGMESLGEEQPWVEDYLERMMQDKKFIDDSFFRIRTEKIFEWAESQVQKEEKPVTEEEFSHELHKHQHEH
jgi:FKBP-type peptidyl-prolyl cis-trans isomerase (trigger factor)